MPYAFRHQPLKGLYLVYQLISTLFVRFPLWMVLGLPKSWRPGKTWSLKTALMVNIVRHYAVVTTQTGSLSKEPDHTAIVPGEGVNGVWISSAGHLITGDVEKWANIANVKSVRLPGYWIHKEGSTVKVAEKAKPGEKVLLFLHGGGYIGSTAHPSDPTANIPRGILEHVDSIDRSFSLEYRLSITKPFKVAYPFPTALIDAVTAYNYLVDTLSFEPSNIILVGDSAGGNLVLALARYLIENKDSADVKLPAPPGGLILLAPWVDLSQDSKDMPNQSNAILSKDLIGRSDGALEYSALAFVGLHGPEFLATNRYISPASPHLDSEINFKDFPRTFMVGGDAEIFIGQIRALKAKMAEDLGEGDGAKEGEGRLRYYESPETFHDHLRFPWFEPQRTDTLKEIAKWVAAS